jgi:hypothetical protein
MRQLNTIQKKIKYKFFLFVQFAGNNKNCGTIGDHPKYNEFSLLTDQQSISSVKMQLQSVLFSACR